MADSHVQYLRRLAFAGVFAGLAWGAGYVHLIPNFEFLTVILFAGGWVVGPLWGAIAASLGEALYSVFNPFGVAPPLVFLSQIVGMAGSGVLGGVLGRLPVGGKRRLWILVVLAGIVATVWFDLLTNLASGVMFGQWRTTLKMALPFAAAHLGSNAVLFASVGVLLVRALEPARRSLRVPGARGAAVALLVAAALALGPARAAEAQARAEAPAHADTVLVTQPRAASPASIDSAYADSVAYRDRARSAAPPAWGEGPAAVLRRDAPSLAALVTREGGFAERWADDRGSAEPLGRFGIAAPRAVLVDWLGLPLTGVGAPGGELGRVAVADVAAYEAPRLPVSATEPYRGELGALTLEPASAVAHHPRVLGWAETGSPEAGRAGFNGGARTRRIEGWVAVAGGSLGPFEPLGPEGDHALASRVAWASGATRLTAAYRSARTAVQDSLGREERRAGEGGALTLDAPALGLAWTARLERTVERTHDASDLIGETIQHGGESRASLAAARAVGATALTARVTAGRQTLDADGTNAFARRTENLGWGSLSADAALGAKAHVAAALGAGAYAHGGLDVAPGALLTWNAAPGRTLWAGAARGLSASPDPRATDAVGTPLPADVAPVRSSTWLAGVGVAQRSAAEATGGAWRGPWARGTYRVRAAVYAGRTSPGRDATRVPLAGEAFEQAAFDVSGAATEYVAFVATGAWAPARGLTLDAGGQALGRTVDPALVTGDPEARAHLTLEARRVLVGGALDARLAATGEWIGPRLATAAGNLPAATRLGFTAHAIVDEFELRLSLDNALGSNRALPVVDASSGAPVPAAQRAFRVQFRWTFWD